MLLKIGLSWICSGFYKSGLRFGTPSLQHLFRVQVFRLGVLRVGFEV